MNEYIAIADCDDLLPDLRYLGYDDGNTVTLTHCIAGCRVVQLTKPIKTLINNVQLKDTNIGIGLNPNAEPYPRERGHLFNINK
tara:strand:+ start:757 stop:1008 length:252 start_codon:yes stop_codon:yes gene_type:complete